MSGEQDAERTASPAKSPAPSQQVSGESKMGRSPSKVRQTSKNSQASKPKRQVSDDESEADRKRQESEVVPVPKSCLEVLKGPLVDGDLEKVTPDKLLSTRLIGIYFSASWCPPCKIFTPVLVAAHRQIRKKFGSLAWEVVLVPRDREESAWKDYIEHMPWLSLPLGHHNVLRMIDFFAVDRIPRLCVVDSKGEVVCDDARGGMGFGFGLSPIAAYEWLGGRIGLAPEDLVVNDPDRPDAAEDEPPPGSAATGLGTTASSFQGTSSSNKKTAGFKGAKSPGSTLRSEKSSGKASNTSSIKRGKSRG